MDVIESAFLKEYKYKLNETFVIKAFAIFSFKYN